MAPYVPPVDAQAPTLLLLQLSGDSIISPVQPGPHILESWVTVGQVLSPDLKSLKLQQLTLSSLYVLSMVFMPLSGHHAPRRPVPGVVVAFTGRTGAVRLSMIGGPDILSKHGECCVIDSR